MKKIVIISGGAVGVELAGEIADRRSDKDITLAERNSWILNSLSRKSSKRAESILKQKSLFSSMYLK